MKEYHDKTEFMKYESDAFKKKQYYDDFMTTFQKRSYDTGNSVPHATKDIYDRARRQFKYLEEQHFKDLEEQKKWADVHMNLSNYVDDALHSKNKINVKEPVDSAPAQTKHVLLASMFKWEGTCAYIEWHDVRSQARKVIIPNDGPAMQILVLSDTTSRVMTFTMSAETADKLKYECVDIENDERFTITFNNYL